MILIPKFYNVIQNTRKFLFFLNNTYFLFAIFVDRIDKYTKKYPKVEEKR